MTESRDRYVILAALQFDETGDNALAEAVRFALRDPRAELHVIHSVNPTLLSGLSGDSTSMTIRASVAPDKLREYVDRACAGTTLRVTGHIRAGAPAEVVLQAAADVDADLLVLGTHQRSGFEKLVLGSVAERVLREAHCPVMVAMPKSYKSQMESNRIEPPCADCLAARASSHDATVWCERHSRTRLPPHVYTPSDRPRNSVMSAS